MKYRIKFELSRQSENIKSHAEGNITADNFDEMAEEIKRWIENNGAAAIFEVEEL